MNLALFLFLVGILGFILNCKNIILSQISIDLFYLLAYSTLSIDSPTSLLSIGDVVGTYIFHMSITIPIFRKKHYSSVYTAEKK